MKSRLRPLYEYLIRTRFRYSRGMSWLGYISAALSAGVFVKGTIQEWLIVTSTLIVLSISIGYFEQRFGGVDYENDYVSRQNPMLRKIERGVEKHGRKMRRVRQGDDEAAV